MPTHLATHGAVSRLLTSSSVTKLADFGLARSSSAVDQSGPRDVVGTIGYMAPEQFDQPSRVDHRSDLYSLGVTAYQACTGELPFADRDPAACAQAHRRQPVVPPKRLVPTLPLAMSELIVAMMAKRPQDRPQSYAVPTAGRCSSGRRGAPPACRPRRPGRAASG